MGNKLNEILKIEVKVEVLINIILYSVILLMPFIVVNVSFPRYSVGKELFLYGIGILLFVIIICLKTRRFTKEELAAFIFLLTMLIPSILSPVRGVAIWGSVARGEGFVIFSIYIMLFFLAHRYLSINKNLLTIILISASIMALYSILQFYGFDPIQKWMFGYISNPTSIGFIGNRNFLSSYICIFLFISMAVYIFYGGKRYLIFSSILFTGLICTLTRSGWLAFLIYSIIGLTFILRDKALLKRALKVFIIFLIIFLILNNKNYNNFTNRAVNTISINEETKEVTVNDSGRIGILKIVWKAFMDKPFMGWGPDTLKYRLNEEYNELQNNYISDHGAYIDKAHNEFLEYAVCNGIFNLLAYLYLIWLIIYKLIGEINNNISKILLLTLIGYLIQSFFNISVVMVAPLFWIFLGFSLQERRS